MSENPLWRRAWQAILAHAVFRLESALTIAAAILLIGLVPRPLPFWRWWYWLILFAIAEGLIVWTSVTDERTAEAVVGQVLRERFDPAALHLESARLLMEQALQYRQAIERQVARRRRGALQEHLRQIATRVDDWLAEMYRLAQRLDRYANDDLIRQDAETAPKDISRYRARLEETDDDQVRQQLQRAIASKEAQVANLQELAQTMERAQLQLENTVSALGTIYSQVLLLEAKDTDSRRMQRLTRDISDETKSLADIVSTLDELYEKSSEA